MEIILLLLVVLAAGALYTSSQKRKQTAAAATSLEDAKAEARRWYELLGGQLSNLSAVDGPARQALADASERYIAAGSQLDQARTVAQSRLVTQTAVEGLYYVRAARTAMDLDPGPPLPEINGQKSAGAVTEEREVDVEGRSYGASPNPSERNQHYYPGGRVAGRPVPQGWYSEPWWRPALIGGAWGLGSVFLFSAMFGGMAGVPSTESFEQGYSEGYGDGAESGDGGGDSGGDGGGDAGGDGGYGDGGGYGDSGGYGDGGGYEAGGGDMSGGFGGGDFGGGDFGGF
ncbi:MAG: DUF1542 domain-containing protein [Actinomycetota bacterium]|nr:DUF1542 domain-containing protein [Actinomycetota bacterium]